MKKFLIAFAILFIIPFSFSACGNNFVEKIGNTGNTYSAKTFDEKLKDSNQNIDNFSSLPDWALEIGLKNYSNFSIDQRNSSLVEANGVVPDSFDVTYTGEISELFNSATDLANKYSLSFTLNDIEDFNLLADGVIENGKYNMSIYVDGKTFELSVVNLDQMNEYN